MARAAAAWLLAAGMGAALAQTCAAPGKDAPGTISGIVNTYYTPDPASANLAAGATSVTVGAASGAAATLAAGDLLLVMQMQGATIDSSDDLRYGDGTGAAASTATTTISQAGGYTALGQAGLYEYVRVTGVAGSVVSFTPALANSYVQNVGAQPRRTYQVIRVPQYPSATVTGITALAWTGLVGGVAAIDVAGVLTASGAGPHVDASNRGFRGGVHAPTPNSTLPGTWGFRSTNYDLGGSKGEGIAGTPRYVQTNTQGAYNSGTAFNDTAPTSTDNGAGHVGYPNGDAMRGAPGNAGGGGNSHNAAGGGGGNGGYGGNGGQTYNGDTPTLADRGGYGGSRTPQDGVLLATRIFMGGGGGSGSMNNSTPPRASGGNGGGIVMVRAGRITGSLVLRADGQRGWDDNNGNDAAGGGGAGGSIIVTAGAGHGNVTAQARGGNGGNSNKSPRTGAPNQPCCDGEREGPGGGAGGGVVITNATLGSTALGAGANGISYEDLFQGFSGNMLAGPGSPGASAVFASSAFTGARPGYECMPALAVTKVTSTPARSVPPDTTGNYSIVITNPATASGAAYGIALTDSLPSPFTLNGATYTVTLSLGASAGGADGPFTAAQSTAGVGSNVLSFGTAGGAAANTLSLQPGASATVTFNIALNGATAGTYQNAAAASFADPTRTSGAAATAAGNPVVTPGGTNVFGSTMPGSNYTAGSSTAEDIVVTGVAGTSADLQMAKSAASAADVGDAFQYVLTVSNAGPSNVTGSITISDNVPANVGTVTWICSVLAGTADCDTALGGTGATGSGNAVQLTRASINSGAQLQVVISGTVASTGTRITNTATVSLPAGFTDPVPANNTDTVTTTFSTPSADLAITKTAGVTSVETSGILQYTISVQNNGPSAADGAVVADPAATGLTKLSVSCSSTGGAVCPGSLSTTTFQAGVAIPVLPSGGGLTFLLNAQVTSAANTTVTNTVTITAPAGVNDPNTANNTSRDADPVTAALARVTSAAQVCPAGTTEQLTNLLANSDFADTSSSVGANVTQYPVNTDIADNATYRPAAVGPMTGYQNRGTYLDQRPFPGDGARGVAAASNWLYSNGNQTNTAPFRVWRQPVSGLVAGRTYEFMFYGSNARRIGQANTNSPIIQPRITVDTTTYNFSTVTYATHATGTSDTWSLQQTAFVATATSADLEIWDNRAANVDANDNWAVTQILLRECRPNPDPFVTKTNGTNTVTTFTTTNYVITVGNNGPGDADNVLVIDPAATGITKTALSCQASGTGAACPLAVSIAGLEGAGLTIPTLPVGTTVVFTVTASVTAINGTVTNSVQITLPAGVTDVNSANNTAQDVDTVRGSSQLTVAKDNGVNAVTSGGTTAYTITVSNLGPSAADGAVLQDPASAGLTCQTPVVCNATGGASCGGASPFNVPLATLQGGFPIPTLPSGGAVTLRVSCSVTATGS